MPGTRQWKGHPLISILLTIFALFHSSTFTLSAVVEEKGEIMTTYSLFDLFSSWRNQEHGNEIDEKANLKSLSSNINQYYENQTSIDELESNVPFIQKCSDNFDEPEQAELEIVNVYPPCDVTQAGYCGIRRKTNYTLRIKYIPKFAAKSMYVRVTTKDPVYGWETLIWPEFNSCNRFNITCPQNSTAPVRALVQEQLPSRVPPMKGLVKVRLYGFGENNIRRLIICREFKARIF